MSNFALGILVAYAFGAWLEYRSVSLFSLHTQRNLSLLQKLVTALAWPVTHYMLGQKP